MTDPSGVSGKLSSMRHAAFIGLQRSAHIITSMAKYLLSTLLGLTALCGSAHAATVVDFSVSGVFSLSDIANPPIEQPGETFTIAFAIPTNPTPLAGSVSSLGFDIAPGGVYYTLNGAPVSLTSSEVSFYTLADGGGVNVTFGTGLTAESFSFQGAQLFTGTTAAPVFSVGAFSVASFLYSDASNFDTTATTSGVTLSPAPEPSTYLLVSAGILSIIGLGFRKATLRR
jgi:hypothetical protein